MKTKDIQQKFSQYSAYRLYQKLPAAEQELIRALTFRFRLSFQEFRQLTDAGRDLDMWGEEPLQTWWRQLERETTFSDESKPAKTQFMSALRRHMNRLKNEPKQYANRKQVTPVKPVKSRIQTGHSNANIFGWCPVASEKTVCCNLRTIDAVQSCAFGCTYCTIQTFYNQTITIEADLKAKLNAIPLEPSKRIHIGTGQSSDSLVWGNRNGMLDTLFEFARSHPQVLLEFKTKSDNIAYFLEHETPPNIVCSWSLNPQEIIENEEYFTAGLEQRLSAARTVADRGVKVAFHFHPIIIYDRWEEAYPQIAREILARFKPEEVLFISFGSVTFIKPVIKKIREQGLSTKILQMDFVTDPHGKLTYADEIKIRKFRLMHQTFSPWHDTVFFYLCMEKAAIWKPSLGYVYETNEQFEQALLDSCFTKINT